MIVAVRASVSAGSITMAASGSRAWILARGVTSIGFPEDPSPDDPPTVTFTAGVCTDWEVPPDVTRLLVEMEGAAGGQNQGVVGYGGYMQCLVRVTPGHQMRTCVGTQGGNQPGFNGGGYAGGDGDDQSGGGMTSLYDVTLGLYLVIAGGGGASGQSDIAPAAGGSGGWPEGQRGQDNFANPGSGAAGGTQTTGYMQFQGGVEYDPGSSDRKAGGGAGWWGGYLAGARGGGGGGSSYFNPTYAVMISHQTGRQPNNGTCSITY